MNFDGHYIRNGFKAMATSHYRQFNHIATPDELGFSTDGYAMEVENLRLNDFRSAMRFYSYTGVLPSTYDIEWKLENMYMESQGNLGAFHKSYRTYQDRPYWMKINSLWKEITFKSNDDVDSNSYS